MVHYLPPFGLNPSVGSNVRRRSGSTVAKEQLSPVAESVEQSPDPAVLPEPFLPSRPQSEPLAHSPIHIGEGISSAGTEADGYHPCPLLTTYTELSRDVDTPSTRFPNIHPSTSQRSVSASRFSWIPYPDSLPSSDDDLPTSEEDHTQVANPGDSEDSTLNCRSPASDSTAVSWDSGRGRTPLFVGTTNFTSKWPRPITLKREVQTGYKIGNSLRFGELSLALEKGQGLASAQFSKWTTSKVWLLCSIATVFAYGLGVSICAGMTWFNAWRNADVMTITDYDILLVITLSANWLVFSANIGLTGALLNSRPYLAIYTLLLWPGLMAILSVGYMAYKRITFNFDNKLRFAWNRFFTVQGKQVIQDSLQCCGFYNAMHEASPSKRCYLRAPLPGCRDALVHFERRNLAIVWKIAFLLAGLHILNMVVALLCSNHVSNRFGKGLTPQEYRLGPQDVKDEADRIFGEMDSQNVLLETEGKQENLLAFKFAPVE